MIFLHVTIATLRSEEKTFNVRYILRNIQNDRCPEHILQASETNALQVDFTKPIVLKSNVRFAAVYPKSHLPSSSGRMPSAMERSTKSAVWMSDVVGINLQCGENEWVREAHVKTKMLVESRN